MIVKLLTEHHLEFLSLKGGRRGSSESTHVKMSNCWKSHALAHIVVVQTATFYDYQNIMQLILFNQCYSTKLTFRKVLDIPTFSINP